MVFGSSKKDEKKTKDFTGFQYEEAPRAEEKPASFIGKTVRLEGELFSEDDLIIEGQVKGKIEVNQTLTIGRNGDVTADINAKTVKISGKVKGNIEASEKVVVLPEGNFNGNIKSQKLVVAEGAILMGNINKEEEPRSETKPIRVPEDYQGSKNNSGKKHSPKNSKNKSQTPSEEPALEPEKVEPEPEVIEAEIE